MDDAEKPALVAFLRRLRRRSGLTVDEERAILALEGERRDVRPRRDLVSPGETVRHSVLVESGLVGRFDLMRDGARQITAIHLPGDMCDLHSVVSPTTGWGITALTSCAVIEIPHEALRRLATDRPNIGLAFWRDTTLDASILAKWVANIGRKDAGPRLAHFLCEMGVRLEQAGVSRRDRFRLELTQEQIGDILGLTSVHVNRTVQLLRAQGLIVTAAREARGNRPMIVEVPDVDRLVHVAEFTPAYLLDGEVDGDPERARPDRP